MTTLEGLRDKLRRIEALYAGATTDGERIAAAEAIARIRQRLQSAGDREPAIEVKVKLSDDWTRQLFVALCKRYGIKPFRYERQRRTTVMIRVPKTFLDRTLWPEFQDLSAALREYLQAATRKIIEEEVWKDAD
ncbi:MAG: hypothetical protein R2762_26755 [Bryobacteraceae bacterium]